MTDTQLLDLIGEQGIDIESGFKGNRLFGHPQYNTIRKIELNWNDLGKKRGLRLVALVIQIEQTMICLHIYKKSKKKDMSQQEYENLKEILNQFQKKDD